MITRTQHFYNTAGEEVLAVVHLYSDIGHFERDGLPAGNHIQLGTADSAENYDEVPDATGGYTNIPDSLPDVILEDPEDEEDATPEDYEAALADLGVE